MYVSFQLPLTHIFFPHFVMTYKDRSVHFGVPNEKNEEGLNENGERSVNAQ